MKIRIFQILIIILTILILLTFIYPNKTMASDTTKEIKTLDSNLYTALKEEINYESCDDTNYILNVKQSELDNTRKLKLTYKEISDISILSNFTNLTSLNLQGNNIKDKCGQLLDYGVDEVFVYDSEEYDKFRIEPYSAALEDYINNNKPSIMLVGGTTLGRSLAPRLAARFKTGLTADCTILDVQENTDLDQIRPAFGGNIMAHINTPNSRPQFATVRYKIFNIPEKVEDPKGKVTLCSVEKDKLTSNIKVLETKIKNKVVGIEEAEVIVVASRAFKKEEDLKMLNELADALGAQIAGTRPTIECGWVDPKKQIGLSGRTVKPKLIITCGVSGAVQFVAGMKGSDYIIAINQDEKAPIFDVAHLGIIGDIYEIIPKLTEKIKAMKNEDTQKVAQMAK